MDNPTEWIPRSLSADGMIECTDEHRRDFPQTYVRSEQYNYLASLVRELEARIQSYSEGHSVELEMTKGRLAARESELDQAFARLVALQKSWTTVIAQRDASDQKLRRIYGLLQRHYGKADAVMPNDLDELEAALETARPSATV